MKEDKKPEIIRDKQGKFLKGISGNPTGKSKGTPNHNGLTACLNAIQDMFEEKKNAKKFRDAVQKAFDKSPLNFYARFGMPLLPKNLTLTAPEGTEVQAVITVKPIQKNGSDDTKKST